MTRKKNRHKQLFGTHPVPGQSRKFVYVYGRFFFSLMSPDTNLRFANLRFGNPRPVGSFSFSGTIPQGPKEWKFQAKTLAYKTFQNKILAPIKVKSALPPPKTPPPSKEEFYGHGFFLQRERIFPGAHKIGAAISGPRTADK